MKTLTFTLLFTFFAGACAHQPGEPTGGPTIDQTLGAVNSNPMWCAIDHTYKLHDIVEYSMIDHNGVVEVYKTIMIGYDDQGMYMLQGLDPMVIHTNNEHAMALVSDAECQAPASMTIGLYPCDK